MTRNLLIWNKSHLSGGGCGVMALSEHQQESMLSSSVVKCAPPLMLTMVSLFLLFIYFSLFYIFYLDFLKIVFFSFLACIE